MASSIFSIQITGRLLRPVEWIETVITLRDIIRPLTQLNQKGDHRASGGSWADGSPEVPCLVGKKRRAGNLGFRCVSRSTTPGQKIKTQENTIRAWLKETKGLRIPLP